MFAAFLQGKSNGSIKLDPYFRWVVRYRYMDGDVGKEVEDAWYPLHSCSAEEASKFWTPANENTSKLITEDREQGFLYCLHPELIKKEISGAYLGT